MIFIQVVSSQYFMGKSLEMSILKIFDESIKRIFFQSLKVFEGIPG